MRAMYKSKLDTRIQEDRLATLVHNLPSSLVSTAAVSLFLFYVVVDKVQYDYALSWLGAILLLTIIRSIHLYKIRTSDKALLQSETSLLFGIFLSGLFFGSSAIIIFPHDDIAAQALSFFLLSSMIAGSVPVFSTHIPAFIFYSSPITLAFLYRATTLPDMLVLLFAIGIIYYAVILSSLIRVNHSIIKSLKTQYLNHDLADNLSKAKEELERSNKELQVENSVREETEKRLYHLANYDPLTGLANRRMFKENLKHSIKSANEGETSVALLFLDLDNFKIINDTLGHAMGDKLLIAASSRLKSLLNTQSSVSRLGGDEFVILMNAIEDTQEVAQLADNIINLLEQPFTFNEHEMFIGTSIGISLYPQDAKETETLLSYADAAMYRAKDKGKNNYQFFSSKMYEKIQTRHNIETKLHHAVENNEFRIDYQPKINLKTQEVIGAEALLRWVQKDLGEVSPSIFIPIAEESSLINAIGKWVITQVCKDLSHLKNNFNNDLCISLNVSSSQILHQNLPELIKENLQTYDLDAKNLELEFTENMLIKQGRKSLQVLQTLSDMGITLSIDDFGTGYSSLNYLKILPIHTLKIDKSFIADTPHGEGDCAIAKSIISLARNLNLDVVAEGVESAEQLNFLKDNGCNLIQGFYFSKPLDINSFSAYLNAPASKIEKALLINSQDKLHP